VQHEKVATRGEPFDMTMEGWGADYPDPSNFLNVLLDGTRIQPNHNQNVAYFNNATYNKRLADAYKLSGDQRLKTYAELDRDIMKNEAPLAPFIDRNARFYVSDKVGCFSVSPTRATLHLTVVCKK
jgi:ABC-type oligopeptide transport system substrate-binding subunit